MNCEKSVSINICSGSGACVCKPTGESCGCGGSGGGSGGGSLYEGYIGEYKDFYERTPFDGWAIRNGALLTNAEVNHPALWKFLQKPENAWKLKTEAEWQALNAAEPFVGVGGANFFVLDEVANTVRLPDTRGMYSAASGWNSTVTGDVVGDAIRNIEGTSCGESDSGPTLGQYGSITTGAFVRGDATGWYATTSSTHRGTMIKFDASNVVPTDIRNHPATMYMLPCVYVGGASSTLPIPPLPETDVFTITIGKRVTGTFTNVGYSNSYTMGSMTPTDDKIVTITDLIGNTPIDTYDDGGMLLLYGDHKSVQVTDIDTGVSNIYTWLDKVDNPDYPNCYRYYNNAFIFGGLDSVGKIKRIKLRYIPKD